MTTSSETHLAEVRAWLAARPAAHMTAAEAGRTAVVAVDIINGFTREGPLGSPRVEAIVPACASLMRGALAAGVTPARVCLMGDWHPEDAEEFRVYPPHAMAGSSEAQWVDELRAVPQFSAFQSYRKNSIASHHTPEFTQWLDSLDADTIVVIGDVTDLCLYALALHLVTRSMHHGLGQRIVVPENCVQTWDAPDHPAELYHPLFLYQLARNGVEVVSSLTWEAHA